MASAYQQPQHQQIYPLEAADAYPLASGRGAGAGWTGGAAPANPARGPPTRAAPVVPLTSGDPRAAAAMLENLETRMRRASREWVTDTCVCTARLS
jgi:hypothetical protein